MQILPQFTMKALVPVPITCYSESFYRRDRFSYSAAPKESYFPPQSSNFVAVHRNRCNSSAVSKRNSVVRLSRDKYGMFLSEEKWRSKKRVVLVRFKQHLGFNGESGRRDDGNTARVVWNLALAIGLTFLTMNGQLSWVFDAIGWVLDALISLWLLAIVLPIIGVGAFICWAGRDMVQGTCPNCGNDFQVFKSTVNDEVQLCPFCSQPFSVEGGEFVKESVRFSNSSSPFGHVFNDFVSQPDRGKTSSNAVVDVEAEVKDAD